MEFSSGAREAGMFGGLTRIARLFLKSARRAKLNSLARLRRPTASQLSNLGAQQDRQGFTKAGRSLAKHSQGKRSASSAFPQAKGNPSQYNSQAQAILDDIIADPSSIRKIRPGKAGEQLLQINKPNGTGVIYKFKNGQWEFSHFAENLY
jgi:hypothetical protein